MYQISTPKKEMENKEAEAGIKNMRQSLTIGDYDSLSERKDINEMISSNALCVKLLWPLFGNDVAQTMELELCDNNKTNGI